MSLSSLYLDAFTEVAKLKSFSQAAVKLHVTQSALSQRVLNLEAEIGSSLFIRDPAGLRLTDLGQRLLRYCHSKSMLEDEFMETLKPKQVKGLSGIIRVAGFSTVSRSVLLPLLAGFLKDNPDVHIEMHNKELRHLPGLLYSGAADLVLMAHPIDKQGVENHLLGHEEYVMIQSAVKSTRNDIYLDYDEEDMVTLDFFKLQSRKPTPIKRNFLDDIEGLIDGVRLGIGRAIVPLHLIKDTKGIEVVKGYTAMKTPVYLSYYTQAFFTELQKRVTEQVKKNAGKYLS